MATCASTGATDTWGRRPEIRAVKTTPSSLSSPVKAVQASTSQRVPPALSTPAGVGWFEAEAVPLFEGLDPLGQAAGQREKLLRAAIGVDQVLIEDAHCRRSRKPSSATGACKNSAVAV
jgi:hypothetical protein